MSQAKSVPVGDVASESTFPALSEGDWREMVLRLAHEIRNPLATIKSATQLVLRLAKPEGEVAECLQGILGNVTRIDRTLQDLQRFVRIDKGTPVAVDVATAIDDAVAQQRPHARRVGLGVEVVGGPPARVLIDPANLALALDELISNAIRVTPTGGKIWLSWVGDAQQVLIHVDDEGEGVPPEVADRILRPFFSTAAQGTGLGLNLVDRVCRLAAGSLVWRNLAGKGCRFTLRLPAV